MASFKQLSIGLTSHAGTAMAVVFRTTAGTVYVSVTVRKGVFLASRRLHPNRLSALTMCGLGWRLEKADSSPME